MVRGRTNLQRNRDEQRHLRNQLAHVYDVVRDLGLHYETKEIPGCSFITIGRTEHRFSHLDKNLALTAPATEEHVEEKNVRVGDDKVSNLQNLTNQAFQSLQKAYREKEEVVNILNLQVSNLTTQISNLSLSIQAKDRLADEEAFIKTVMERTVEDQSDEIHRLTNKISELFAQLQADTEKKEETVNDIPEQQNLKKTLEQLSSQLVVCKAEKIRAEELADKYKETAEKYKNISKTPETDDEEETKLDLERTVQNQRTEIQSLTSQLSKRSSLLQDEIKKKKEMSSNDALKQEDYRRTLDQLSKELEACKSNAEKSAEFHRIVLENEEYARKNSEVNLVEKLHACRAAKEGAETKISELTKSLESAENKVSSLKKETSDLKSQVKSSLVNDSLKQKSFESLEIKLSMSENTISELTKSLENAENNLSSIKEETSDKDDKIKTITDLNKSLKMEKSKILAKLQQQEEDHELQLAYQENLRYKSNEIQLAFQKIHKLDSINLGHKGEIKGLNSMISKLYRKEETRSLTPQTSEFSPKGQRKAKKKKKSFFCPMQAGIPRVWEHKQLSEYNPSKPEDCTEAAEELATENPTQTEIICKWFEAFSNNTDTIVTAEMKFFDDAFTDNTCDLREYVKDVEKQILSEDEVGKGSNNNPCPNIATLVAEIGSSVEDMDKLIIFPDYKEFARALGNEIILGVLPDLACDQIPYEIDTPEKIQNFKRAIKDALDYTLEMFLDGQKIEAHEAIKSWGDDTEESTDNDVSECESSFDKEPKRDSALLTSGDALEEERRKSKEEKRKKKEEKKAKRKRKKENKRLFQLLE